MKHKSCEKCIRYITGDYSYNHTVNANNSSGSVDLVFEVHCNSFDGTTNFITYLEINNTCGHMLVEANWGPKQEIVL